jgi:hypothetical protein
VLFGLEVDGTPGAPITVESTSDPADATSWTPTFTTNSMVMPIRRADWDVAGARKFYRARQP